MIKCSYENKMLEKLEKDQECKLPDSIEIHYSLSVPCN